MTTGSLMAAEMAEQPAVLQRLLDRRAELRGVVRSVVPRRLCGISLVARGSSDHAALYGRYVLELAAARPAAMAAPSLQTLYQADVDHRGYLVIAISQSGRTPEIVRVVERMRRSGARTLAIVNDARSPLAAASHAVICLDAGQELAVPATKTFTATVFALGLVAAALGTVPWSDRAAAVLPAAVAGVLADDAPAEHAAQRLVAANRVLVTGRGLLMSAAAETALKIRETSAVFAEALSTADLRHGPIAAVTPDVPVVALTAGGPPTADVDDLVRGLRERAVDVTLVAPGPGATVPLPSDLPEALQAVTASIRGQQLARHLALARNLDPDAPEGLTKVTMTN